MKSFFPLVMVIFLSLSFSGCRLLQVKGEVSGVEVDVKTKKEIKQEKTKFCPPGQAKKCKC